MFLITDDFLATTDVYKQAVARLGDRVSVYTGVKPNPTTSEIGAGVAVYMKAQPDVVVAYGGGSAMDAAKVMHKTALEAGFGAPLGIVAIPTTSGSGSEVTSFAVVTDETTHTKIPIISEDLVAKLAILDPAAVAGVPAHITADSGMDALTHAIEAYVATDANDLSDAMAEKAIKLILPICCAATPTATTWRPAPTCTTPHAWLRSPSTTPGWASCTRWRTRWAGTTRLPMAG